MAHAAEDLRDVKSGVTFEADPYKAAEGAHAIAVMTEWKLYAELDFARIFKSMSQPAFIFDGRNILDHRKLFKHGFNVYSIGKATLKHF